MKALIWLFAFAVTVWAAPAWADAAEEGRKLYSSTCSKCHGEIDEAKTSRLGRARLDYVVMTPLGPNLTGIFGRPAGSFVDYRYSNAFRADAKGLVWDEATLDRWLTNSQAMIRGSYMFFKLKQPKRGKIIAYLEKYSRYRK